MLVIQGLQDFELPEEPPWDSTTDPMDTDIIPLVKAINAAGWCRTRQSCSGHTHNETGPWLWLEMPQDNIPVLLKWMDRANARLPEWLIDAHYIGSSKEDTVWFEIRGRYLHEQRNKDIRTALLETLS